jgi:ADP-glucose pyrophosphorylase
VLFSTTGVKVFKRDIFPEEQVLAATQTPGEAGKKWFQGTADAVRQFIWMFEVRAQNFAFC